MVHNAQPRSMLPKTVDTEHEPFIQCIPRRYTSPKTTYRWMPGRTMYVNAHIVLPRTPRSARRMHLKSWHLLQPIANLSFVCLISRKFIPSKIFFLQISIPAILFTLLMAFLEWESYPTCPFAENKQRIRIVNFPAGRTYSLPFAGHAMILHRVPKS